jgi:pyruvate,orthophosphate dikinase
MHDIPESWGTAVNVQSMVFGNMGGTSATGVAFTRNPSTGEAKLYGEFLINAQGEDVVAGIRTPQSLTRAGREEMGETTPSMEEAMPVVFAEFVDVVGRLESHYRDMQDIEFTVEQGRLWMLQTRNGKRTAKSALKIAVDLAAEGVISEEEAVSRVEPSALDQLLHPTLDPNAARTVVAAGLPASPGAATGKIVFDADEAERLNQLGDAVILVREETSPEDIHGMHAARGIVTARGGMTSHAAVVARGMGRPCVCGINELSIDEKANGGAGTFTARGRVFRAGEIITIDGSKGEVLDGAVAMIEPELTGDFQTLMAWADKVRRLRVRANAETPLDAKTARGFGAEGIGLCRTEHMFFDDARIAAVREMILADDEAGRRMALAKIAPFQKADFVELFTIMAGLPVTVRLLDPPLHEFIPHSDADIDALAVTQGLDAAKLKRRAKELHETNPMLGHRGCRLGVAYPEIYEMQVRAILEAALEVKKTAAEAPIPEIMHPLVALGLEMKYLRELTDRTAEVVFAEAGDRVAYLVGTMIELPRAALRAADLAEYAEFFSFGTNDLTQTTFGISRDDSGRFLQAYMDKGIFETDPFVRLDQDGVGDLIRIAAERGGAARPGIKMGICGEHGGDPSSIAFCEQVGLDYVSCSPYRVPIARLAAAQAALHARAGTEREKDR